MISKSIRRQRIATFAILLSLVMVTFVPASTMNAQALTGFVKTSPSNGATGLTTSLTLKWSAAPANPYDHDTYYKYCYYKSGGTCTFQGILYTTEQTISGLAKSTKYFWQVQVVYCKDNSCTNKEKHDANNGTVWSFTTSATGGVPPGAFAKLLPANGATNVASKVLSWAASVGATSYQVCFSSTYNDSNCAYLSGWKDVGNVTTYTLPNDSTFIWGNRYYWQVRASNAGETTLANDGTWWSFTTEDRVGSTTLISPTGVINDSTPPYKWNQVPNATWYYLWVNGPSGLMYSKWYDENTYCNGTTCEVNPTTPLNAGNYTWWVQTWGNDGYGPWSNGMAFNAPVLTPPGAATQISPSGGPSTEYTPTYTWNDTEGASSYYLWVEGPSGYMFNQWYTSAQANCNGSTCSVKAAKALSGGEYKWWIQTKNSAGAGPWSAGKTFSLLLPPVKAQLTQPNGNITTNAPTYLWKPVPQAAWYLLMVEGSSGTVFSQWYTPTQANCDGTSCSVTPSVTLDGGTYKWRLQSWNEAGYSPWSDSLSFNVPLPAPPAKVILVEPNAVIGTSTPTYKWNQAAGATEYYLWIEGPSGLVFNQWYTFAQANCNGTTCSVTPNVTLGAGAHQWWIQAKNSGGAGAWSDAMNFTLATPGKATLNSPNGSITTSTPLFEWQEVHEASWYFVWVEGASGTAFKQWYSSAQANCDGTTCSVLAPSPLGTGSYSWYVLTWNEAGYGLWSDVLTFSAP